MAPTTSNSDSGTRPYTSLLTDFYQLTMLDAYHQLGMQDIAVFEFYVRRLPDCRNFLVAAGLEQALDYLETLRFNADDLDWLRGTRHFSDAFLTYLEGFSFTGDVLAMPEGTVFFGSEPVLRVTAPLPQAQFVESRLINLMQYQTLVASKAARCRLWAGNARLVDFGMRRAHGAEAALLASRASYLAGFDATATVDAARRYGIPLAGTLAHSFIQAHDLEADAFARFAQCRPDNLVLLIDTYDTARGAERVAALAQTLARSGTRVRGVRIDSGDLQVEVPRVRRILDAAGCTDIEILVSGNLDEHDIQALRAAQMPIDTFCLGTKVCVSNDAAALDCAYKLQQYAGKPCRKHSIGKETWPGPRQVYRQYDAHDRIAYDLLACADEIAEGKALLREVMVNGQRKATSPPLDTLRAHCKRELASLPPMLCSLEKTVRAPVKVSARQHALAESVDAIAH